MADFSEYFRSVGDVWVIWLISILGLGALTCRALSRSCSAGMTDTSVDDTLTALDVGPQLVEDGETWH